VAYGSAAAGLPGTTIPRPADLRPDTVRVQQLDPS
jgi:1-phosphofructokinase